MRITWLLAKHLNFNVKLYLIHKCRTNNREKLHNIMNRGISLINLRNCHLFGGCHGYLTTGQHVTPQRKLKRYRDTNLYFSVWCNIIVTDNVYITYISAIFHWNGVGWVIRPLILLFRYLYESLYVAIRLTIIVGICLGQTVNCSPNTYIKLISLMQGYLNHFR